MTKLSNTQIEVLTAAALRSDRSVFPMPERLKNQTIIDVVLNALVAKGFVDEAGVITGQGLNAVGRGDSAVARETPKTVHTGTKKALFIELLRRPEGVTMDTLQKELAPWLEKTIRGTMSNLKNKDGLNVVSEKLDNGERVYRIA